MVGLLKFKFILLLISLSISGIFFILTFALKYILMPIIKPKHMHMLKKHIWLQKIILLAYRFHFLFFDVFCNNYTKVYNFINKTSIRIFYFGIYFRQIAFFNPNLVEKIPTLIFALILLIIAINTIFRTIVNFSRFIAHNTVFEILYSNDVFDCLLHPQTSYWFKLLEKVYEQALIYQNYRNKK